MHHAHIPTIADVLADPAASHWIKAALYSALNRDPVDAANDAAFLCALLDKRAADAAKEAGKAAVISASSPGKR